MLNENLDISRRVHRLRRIVHCLTLIDHVLADLAHHVGEFLQVVLDEVDLTHVIFLDSVQPISILVLYLVHVLVDQLDVLFVLVLSLASCQLHVIHLRLEGGGNQGGGWRRRVCLDLSFQLVQLVHLVEVVFFGEKHLRAALVQSLPNLVCLLNQDTVRRCVVLAVEVRRFD